MRRSILLLALASILIPTFVSTESAAQNLIINELDADTPGSIDVLEFIELFDGGIGNTTFGDLVVVLYNGATDQSYAVFYILGFATDADGYFVLGNALVPGVDYIIPDSILQNGADAAAIHEGTPLQWPVGTPVTTDYLVDAIVYGTNDPPDAGLLALLNINQPQLNESSNGNSPNESSGRCPNGSGGARNTDTYVQAAPTPGAANTCAAATVADGGASGRAVFLGPPAPNPAELPVAIEFRMIQPGHAVLRVVDIAGRHVATLIDSPLGAGTHRHLWQGVTDRGASVPRGVYIIELDAGATKTSRKLSVTD